MQIKAYQTKKIVIGDDLQTILEDSLPRDIPENSVVAITSKIIAICEGRVADQTKITKDEITKKEADWYLPRDNNQYDVLLSIKNSVFVASAGVDESNGNGLYILWPKDVQQSANSIREFLCSHFNKKNIGVVLTDSHLNPLRYGVTGVCLAHSGFAAIRSYVGKPDIFGRLLRVERVNDADMLASVAVGVMGEGNEQTPLALITDIPFVQFTGENPSHEESLPLMGDLHNDVFAEVLTAVPWKKGNGGK